MSDPLQGGPPGEVPLDSLKVVMHAETANLSRSGRAPSKRAGELELDRVSDVVDLPPVEPSEQALAEQRLTVLRADDGKHIVHRAGADLDRAQPDRLLHELSAV